MNLLLLTSPENEPILGAEPDWFNQLAQNECDWSVVGYDAANQRIVILTNCDKLLASLPTWQCERWFVHRGNNDIDTIIERAPLITLRRYRTADNKSQQFEQLWAESAQSEMKQPGIFGKWLYRSEPEECDYLSVSAWRQVSDAEALTHSHLEWQKDHPPYPLKAAPVRQVLEVKLVF